MHYSDERQEHNEQDWPDNEEWMEAVFQNGPTGCHYPEANHQNLTVSGEEALNDIDNVVK